MSPERWRRKHMPQLCYRKKKSGIFHTLLTDYAGQTFSAVIQANSGACDRQVQKTADWQLLFCSQICRIVVTFPECILIPKSSPADWPYSCAREITSWLEWPLKRTSGSRGKIQPLKSAEIISHISFAHFNYAKMTMFPRGIIWSFTIACEFLTPTRCQD